MTGREVTVPKARSAPAGRGKLKDLASGILDNEVIVHRIWLAGLGALAMAEEEGTKVFSRLVDRGLKIEALDKAEDAEEKVFHKLAEIVRNAAWTPQLQALLVPESAAPPSATETSQLQRNARARKAFLSEIETLTSREVAELAGSRATNQAALANRWKAEGRIFVVEVGGQTLFPAFQFSEDNGQPQSVIAQILTFLQPRFSGWQTALWFTGRNGWLGAKRPVDTLKSDPEAVVEAARREAEAFD
jgi:poly(hydroxyalkanoate) granule associated protein phasin